MSINTNNLFIQFGRYKGERWTRLPISYLRYLINADSIYSPLAMAELERRGVNTEWMVEVSNHAVNRASLRCLRIYMATHNPGEGLHSWLERLASECMAKIKEPADVVYHKGMKFCFSYGTIAPVLKTIMPSSRSRI